MSEYERDTLAIIDNGSCKHDADETCYYCTEAVSPARMGQW